jgi:hypothetical protein
MKQAGPSALDRLEPLLRQLRKQPGLKGPKRGVFYRGSRAFLHFHEHGDAFYADVRFADDFERLPATATAERLALLERVRVELADGIGALRR